MSPGILVGGCLVLLAKVGKARLAQQAIKLPGHHGIEPTIATHTEDQIEMLYLTPPLANPVASNCIYKTCDETTEAEDSIGNHQIEKISIEGIFAYFGRCGGNGE